MGERQFDSNGVMSFQFQRNNILPKHEPLNMLETVGSFQNTKDSSSSPLALFRIFSEPNVLETFMRRYSIHWVPFTTRSVTSTGLLRLHFFAWKSLTTMLKCSVTTNTHLQRAVSLASFYTDYNLGLCPGKSFVCLKPSVWSSGLKKYYVKLIPMKKWQRDVNITWWLVATWCLTSSH